MIFNGYMHRIEEEILSFYNIKQEHKDFFTFAQMHVSFQKEYA